MPNSVVSISAPITSTSSANAAAASTLEDLIACVPRTFQHVYRPVFREWHDYGVKLSHARHALDSFNRHQAASTYPPNILGSLKVPTIQVCKEFDGTSQRQQCTADFDVLIKKWRDESLNAAITTKRFEITHVDGLVGQQQASSASNRLINDVHDRLATTFATGINKEGRTTYSGFYADEKNVCIGAGAMWLVKAVSLGLAKHQRELVSKMSKLSVKKDTDTSMTDMSTNDIRKTIADEIAKALRPSNSKQKKPQKPGMLDVPSNEGTTSLTCYSKETSKSAIKRTSDEAWHQEEGSRSRKRSRNETSSKFLDELELKCSPNFNVRDAFTYPNEFFAMEPSVRCRFLLLHSSTAFVDSLSEYSCDAFIGYGVSLPKDIRMQLSLNGKYCLHAQKNTTLIPAAMQQLQRTVRIRTLFAGRERNRGLYIPKFHTKSDWEPPLGPEMVEDGLDAMQAALFRQVSALPHKAFQRNPETKRLKEFLGEKKYLVKITDKNLGLAIVTEDWYNLHCEEHLRNAVAYQKQQVFSAEDLLVSFKEEIHNLNLVPAILRYLETSTAEFPKFHLIPKVHKTPWASRPIIPSHSWATSRASEVVDYFLQPILLSIPIVLQSTLDFMQKLKKVSLPKEECWLLTGDVKAMYTNIPPDAAVDAVDSALRKDSYEGNSKRSILKLLRFVLANNFFTYHNDTYWQKSGLAMGTACAPAVANIFCAKHEMEMAPNFPEIVFYGRYIDDIFMIMKGSKEDVDLFTRLWFIPGLEISWESSKDSVHFLDVVINLTKDGLVTDLHQKGLNKHMYIPFSSGHPLSVKKGMVKAERTRYRMICSEEFSRLKAEKHLKLNLLRRGYPLALLDKWFSLELKPRERTENILLLPSQYNPVWEYINVQRLEDAFWSKILSDPSAGYLKGLYGNITLGLKRGWNMYDIYNRSNLAILSSMASFGEN